MTVKVIGPIEPPPAGRKLVLWAVPAQCAGRSRPVRHRADQWLA
jgi:hypothetical protein